MSRGVVSLRDLYRHLDENPHPDYLDGRSPIARAYSQVAKLTVHLVDPLSGFYLWGCLRTKWLVEESLPR
jgi:hypothetical protein